MNIVFSINKMLCNISRVDWFIFSSWMLNFNH